MSLYNEYELFEDDSIHPLKIKVIDLIDDYRKINENKWPTDLYLTADDEVSICAFTAADVGGKLLTDLTLMGPRYLTVFFGLKIHWNSNTTCVR